MQSTAGGEKEEEDEGYGVAHSVHHGPSQGAKTQLPQDLKSGQKTVVGGLKVEEVKTEKDRERALLSDIINGTHILPLHATFRHFHVLNSLFFTSFQTSASIFILLKQTIWAGKAKPSSFLHMAPPLKLSEVPLFLQTCLRCSVSLSRAFSKTFTVSVFRHPIPP